MGRVALAHRPYYPELAFNGEPEHLELRSAPRSAPQERGSLSENIDRSTDGVS